MIPSVPPSGAAPAAPALAARRVADALGIERMVIVQPPAHGTGNR